MSRGKVTLDGQEYEIGDVIGSDTVDGDYLVRWIKYMDPGTAIVIIRGQQ